MIHFENLYYLRFEWVVALLVIAWFVMRRRQAASQNKIGDVRLMKKLVAGYSPVIYYLKFFLLIAALTLMVLALARPRLTRQVSSIAPVNQTAVVFALDVSKSMNLADVAPSRLALAKNTMNRIIGGLHGEQVGVVIFAGSANTYVPLTTDYKTLNDAVQYVSNTSVAKQGTALGEALKTSSLLLYPKDIKVRAICILSDGEDLSNSFADAADSCRKAGINLFAFGTGTLKGDYITRQNSDNSEGIEKDNTGKPIISRLHADNLLKVCGNDTSRYHTISNPVSDADGFLKQLNNMQRHIKQQTPVQKEIFQLFLLAVLLLLVIETLIPNSLARN